MSKVKIYTWADKAPEFIYKQYETIKKFVKDEDWEFIVFNNVPAPKIGRQKEIKKICKELGVKCLDVRFRSLVSGAAQICAWGIFWAYHRFFRWEKDTIHVIFDSDMFFINDFNFNEFLGDNDICAIHQRRGDVEYLWNGIVIMRGGELPDKNHFDYRLGTIKGERTDVGGRLYWWIKRNPKLKIKYITHTNNHDLSTTETLPESIRAGYQPIYNYQIIENAILHYRAGSNWNRKTKDFIDAKKAYFNSLLNEVVNNNGKIKYVPEIYVTWEQPEPTSNKKERKVKIYTWTDKAPEFIYKQYETMQSFVRDKDWEFIVFNNTPITAWKRQRKIKQICKELRIKCLDVRFRSFISGASYITGWGILWAYHRFFRWQKNTIQVIFDSDMFFVDDFCFNEYLEENEICAIHQRRGEVEYLWNGIVIMRGADLPDKNHLDFRLGTVEGERTDTGGKTYYWLKRNPDLKIKYINHTEHSDITGTEMIPENIRSEYKTEYNFQFIESSILHYRAGSNWNKKSKDFVDDKKEYLNKFLNEMLFKGGKIKRIKELYECKQ